MSRSILRRAAHAALALSFGLLVPSAAHSAAVSASIVPGSLTQGTVKASLTGGSYASETSNLGDWPLNTGGSSTVFPVSLTNPNFNGSSFGGVPNTMIAFGNGGGVTLKFGAPVLPVAGQKEIGLFTAQGYIASSGGLFNGNMEAAILVSADNVSWRTLSGTVIASPTTYTTTSHPLNAPTLAYNFLTTQQAWSYGLGTSAANLGALSIANFQTPMPDDALFNGVATDAERKALSTDATSARYAGIFGTSGGGNWFDISNSGLVEVNYLRLNGVNVPGSGGVRLDGVYANAAAVPEPGAVSLLVMGSLLLLRRRR